MLLNSLCFSLFGKTKATVSKIKINAIRAVDIKDSLYPIPRGTENNNPVRIQESVTLTLSELSPPFFFCKKSLIGKYKQKTKLIRLPNVQKTNLLRGKSSAIPSAPKKGSELRINNFL